MRQTPPENIENILLALCEYRRGIGKVAAIGSEASLVITIRYPREWQSTYMPVLSKCKPLKQPKIVRGQLPESTPTALDAHLICP